MHRLQNRESKPSVRVARKSRKREGPRGGDLEERLAEALTREAAALEQQTATSEILRLISGTPTDTQPVFDTIAQSAVRVCGSLFGAVFTFTDGLMWLVAHRNFSPEAVEAMEALYPAPPGRETAAGRAILDPQRQIELLQTFANQAVIAVENVRLFRELEARTADLTRSVDQLTALGEVGRAVSSTLDLETVLTTIVSRAVERRELDGGVVFEYDDGVEEFVHRAATETGSALAEPRRATRVRKGEGVVGRTAITLEPVQVPDIMVPGAHHDNPPRDSSGSGPTALCRSKLGSATGAARTVAA